MDALNEVGRGVEQKRLLARFWQSASTFWTGKWARLAWALTAFLIFLAVAQLLVQYQLNVWNRDFFDALERRDVTGLWAQAQLFVPLALASLALASTSVWGRMTTQRKWRESTTRQLLRYWLAKEHFRRLHHLVNGSGNPEYRLTEDLRIATDDPIDLGLSFLASLMSSITFLTVLWSVGGSLDVQLFGHTWVIPAYLVIGVITYSAVFTGLILLVGRNLTTVIENKNQGEAEFRSAADRLRRDGDRGLQANEKAERKALWVSLRNVLIVWRQLLWQLVCTTLVSHSNFVVAPIMGLLLCVPKYVAGTMTLGEVTQAAAAFVIVQNAFNWVVDNYGRFAAWRSSVNRVAKLLIALDTLDAIDRSPEVQRLIDRGAKSYRLGEHISAYRHDHRRSHS
ncbi:MAG TPA: SbmA/BacA-like family transporter [Methyloceanibacter sp.]|jgi:vitamin B12/bleomycin/antimicrobial peptide transport system ATP-binding/permease protein|nr:SbmA/BacA-like family transporter [Methyloceanibacter sp.]